MVLWQLGSTSNQESHKMKPHFQKRQRAREIGVPLSGMPGTINAITDVPGVLVGTQTLSSIQDKSLTTGTLPVQTGVTAILPRGFEKKPYPVTAGQFTLNGNGEMTGTHWIRDGGWFVGPIMITNSHSVGMAHHAATKWMLEHYANEWDKNHLWAIPVVAETYDGVLNDINGMHVTAEHARAAIMSAKSGPVDEGNTGGGAGMICYEFKGGTGTSSRKAQLDGKDFIIGALVQANHGLRPWFTVAGVHVGQTLIHDRIPGMLKERGSIICVIATDIPLSSSQLDRLSRRATIGIGRGGTPGGNSSGDIFVSFSTANKAPMPQLDGAWSTKTTLNDELLDAVYLSGIEAVEEAILNAMLAAEDIPLARPANGICRSLNPDQLMNALNNRNSRIQ